MAASVAELALAEKSRTQSINQSFTHPAYLMPREPKLKASEKTIKQKTAYTQNTIDRQNLPLP